MLEHLNDMRWEVMLSLTRRPSRVVDLSSVLKARTLAVSDSPRACITFDLYGMALRQDSDVKENLFLLSRRSQPRAEARHARGYIWVELKSLSIQAASKAFSFRTPSCPSGCRC